MSYKIIALNTFSFKLKKLSKKYKRIKLDLQALAKELKNNPKAGIPLQHNCYKIRVSNTSIPTGKSGGFRVIYYFIGENNHLYLITIHSKTQKGTLSDNQLLELLKINDLV